MTTPTNNTNNAKDTPRAAATKSSIEQAFVQLLDRLPLSQIGIKEVTEACGINRNTFYYHFKNIPDLIESLTKGFVDEIIASHPPQYDSIEDCFLAATRLALDNQRAIYHIYNSTNRAIFERYLWKICDYSISSYLESLPPAPTPLTPEEFATVRDILKYECFGFVIDWISHGMPSDVMEKLTTFTQLLKTRFTV